MDQKIYFNSVEFERVRRIHRNLQRKANLIESDQITTIFLNQYKKKYPSALIFTFESNYNKDLQKTPIIRIFDKETVIIDYIRSLNVFFVVITSEKINNNTCFVFKLMCNIYNFNIYSSDGCRTYQVPEIRRFIKIIDNFF